MKNYYTISEFAKLRGININSLRYYEKLGLLKPAYSDPHTKYRYYSPEQLSELDTISLCVSLGIPLGKLTQYVDGNGYIQNRKLLEDGKILAEDKISEIQAGIGIIEHTLRYLEYTRQYQDIQGLYTRRISERVVVASEHTGVIRDIRAIEMVSTELYSYAQAQGLSPVLPTGLIMKYQDDRIICHVYFEVANKKATDDKIMRLPESDYSCVQADLTPAMDLPELIETHFGNENNKTVIVSNMILDKFRFGSKRSELQMEKYSKGLFFI